MSQNNKRKFSDIGKIRNSALVTTWGPGSIVQLENDSAVVAGLDAWPEAFADENSLTKFKVLHHPYLQKICKKNHFRMPQSDEDIHSGIPVVSFPSWGYCSNKYCARLQHHKQFTNDPKGIFYCEACKNDLIPARFVLLCKYGHLDDFPWIQWAHSKCRENFSSSQEAHICDNPKLVWRSSNKNTSISSYFVKCLTCEKYRNMSGVIGNDLPLLPDLETNHSIQFSCRGKRPWLGKEQKCPPKNSKTELKTTAPRAEMTRSTSLYFASVITALQIPKFRHRIHLAIQNNWSRVEGNMIDIQADNPEKSFEAVIQEISKKRSIFEDVMDDYSTDEITEKLEERLNPKIENELDIRAEEYHDLINTDFPGDNVIDIEDVSLPDSHKKYLSSLKKINRLTILKALRGFTRSHPPDPFDTDSTKFSKLSTSEKIDWLPGVETKGEGIFFSLDEKMLADWAQKDDVKKRCEGIISSYNEWATTQNIQAREITPKYILLHTLSHVLIRELSFFVGYNEASLAERIYCDDNYNGILIYTSSSSSEGSLGGLVRQGELNNFIPLLNNTLEKSRSCGRDPLCGRTDPNHELEKKKSVYNRLSGSACYSCSLLPETSCEDFNRLLDRKLLRDLTYGFFGDKIE